MGTEAGSSDVLVPASMAASELDAFHSSPKKQPKDVSRALQRYSSEPRLLIVAGPSGVGKGTIVKQLRAYWPSAFGFSVSHTSRQPRPGEAHTREYHFVSREEIEQMRDNGELLEYAEFSGNAYATSFGEIKRISDMGKICLLEIDLCGVLSVREHAFSFAKFVFIEPPSFAELEKRLRLRNTETPESLQRRLEHAKNELERANHLEWDLRLVNDSVEAAWGKLRDALIQWFDLPPNPEK